MPKRTVRISRGVAAPADAVWTVARQFCSDWHPLIEWAKPERDARGRLVRVFKVEGEAGLYRERLTYFSDTDRELRYCHLEGIRDAVFYEASLCVVADGAGAVVEWQAELEAPEPRASEIAKGTEIVFQAGIDALAEAASLHELTIADGPALTVDHTADRPGPLLLFLHGIGGNKGNWRHQLASAGLSHQSVAPDIRGYGGSALGVGQSTIDDHCNDILRVMAAFRKDRVILCGMSLGSWIATSFAMRHPQKLSGLILSGGCTGMSEAPQEEREAFLAARQRPLDAGRAPKDFADDVVNVIAGPQASAEALQQLKESMASIPAATYRHALWCFTHPEERFEFARIACPVLLMTGEHDRLAPPAEIRSVAQRIHDTARNPDVSFEIIPAAGHLCNIESPAVYNHHLTRFLRRLVP